MKKRKLKELMWNAVNTPKELHEPLKILGEHFPITENTNCIKLEFLKNSSAGFLAVKHEKKSILIEYGSLASALRGVAYALSGKAVEEKTSFSTFGIMLDCSRNAVMKVSHLKKWMRSLALMGYNRIMLYTENTYQIPDEPYFGYMRGAYSMNEIKELDSYAQKLGIEMIACIQTLGHMEQIFKWKKYSDIMDTEHIMLAREDKTYQLVEKMLNFWSEALTTRRIHIGMDETQALGRGKYANRFGLERQFDIFNRHLNRVCEMAERYNLKPMIWSDMYFRMSNPKHDYYDRNSVIPDDVKAAIPKNVDLVYWDYTSKEENFYADWIRRHRELGHEPVMASGIWTWARFWYDHAATVQGVVPCIKGCRKEKIKDFMFTMWGDGGSYCEFDSALAGLCWGADIAYGGDGENASLLFSTILAADYDIHIAAGELQMKVGEKNMEVKTSSMLWDDPLFGIAWAEHEAADPDCWVLALKKLKDIRKKLSSHITEKSAANIEYAYMLSDYLVKKIEFKFMLIDAYQSRSLKALRKLEKTIIPEVVKALKKFQKAFRSQWLKRNKSFGMEVIQIRLAGAEARFNETSLRIKELLDGEIDSIEELDVKIKNIGDLVAFFDWIATSSIRV